MSEEEGKPAERRLWNSLSADLEEEAAKGDTRESAGGEGRRGGKETKLTDSCYVVYCRRLGHASESNRSIRDELLRRRVHV